MTALLAVVAASFKGPIIAGKVVTKARRIAGKCGASLEPAEFPIKCKQALREKYITIFSRTFGNHLK